MFAHRITAFPAGAFAWRGAAPVDRFDRPRSAVFAASMADVCANAPSLQLLSITPVGDGVHTADPAP